MLAGARWCSLVHTLGRTLLDSWALPSTLHGTLLVHTDTWVQTPGEHQGFSVWEVRRQTWGAGVAISGERVGGGGCLKAKYIHGGRGDTTTRSCTAKEASAFTDVHSDELWPLADTVTEATAMHRLSRTQAGVAYGSTYATAAGSHSHNSTGHSHMQTQHNYTHTKGLHLQLFIDTHSTGCSSSQTVQVTTATPGHPVIQVPTIHYLLKAKNDNHMQTQ